MSDEKEEVAKKVLDGMRKSMRGGARCSTCGAENPENIFSCETCGKEICTECYNMTMDAEMICQDCIESRGLTPDDLQF